MLQRGNMEDAKALAAEFSRAKAPKRRGNQTGGESGRPAENRPRPNYGATPVSYNTPVYSGTANPRASTLRPAPSQVTYSNGYPNTGGRVSVEPRGPPSSSYARPPVRSGPTSFERTERTFPPQGVAAPQNPGLNQSGPTTRRHVPSPAAITPVPAAAPMPSTTPMPAAIPVPKPQDRLGFNQPLKGYTGPAESRLSDDEEDVAMTDADAPSGYKKLGKKGLEASMWNKTEAYDGGAEASYRAVPRPVPARRPSNTTMSVSTSTTIPSTPQGPGLAQSRWAPHG
ncbi:RNase P and RNase MRP subunit [Hypoxylon texense]